MHTANARDDWEATNATTEGPIARRERLTASCDRSMSPRGHRHECSTCGRGRCQAQPVTVAFSGDRRGSRPPHGRCVVHSLSNADSKRRRNPTTSPSRAEPEGRARSRGEVGAPQTPEGRRGATGANAAPRRVTRGQLYGHAWIEVIQSRTSFTAGSSTAYVPIWGIGFWHPALRPPAFGTSWHSNASFDLLTAFTIAIWLPTKGTGVTRSLPYCEHATR